MVATLATRRSLCKELALPFFPAELAQDHSRVFRPNENKMSDGGRERASLGVEVWKSSQNLSAQRSAVRSIAWLGEMGELLDPRVGEYICCEAVFPKGNDGIR